MPRTKQSESIRRTAAQQGSSALKQKRKTPRFSWRTIASRQVVKAQRNTKNLLAKEPMVKIVKELIHKHSPAGENFRITKSAFKSLHEMASSMLVDLMHQTENVRMVVGKSKAIQDKHMRIARTQLGVQCLSNANIPCYVSIATTPAKKRSEVETTAVAQ